jgi:hypothetical protein
MVRDGVRLYWYSSNPQIVSVTQTGIIRALAVGSATVFVVPQARPFPTAATRVTVAERNASPPSTPALPEPEPPIAPVPPPDSRAELPRVMPTAAVPAPTGRTISVAAGGDLQGAAPAG